LVLGQEAVFEKSNEITAIPALIERLDLAESAPPGTRNNYWKSSARRSQSLVNLDSLPWTG
jgi:hypothetical protein